MLSGSSDRSIRRWERTQEAFFVEEEKEKRLESLFEADMAAEERSAAVAEAGEEGAAAPAGRKTLESVSGADALAEALDLAAGEVERLTAAAAEAVLARSKGGSGKAPKLPPNPLMLGLSPSAYVLRSVQQVRANDLEQCLLLLPFTDALRLLTYLPQWLEGGNQVSTMHEGQS